MKKKQLQVFLVLFSILAVVTWLSTACSSGNNPSGSGSGSSGTATPTPTNAEIIWANGNTGLFFSANIAPVTMSGTILNVSTPDPISGDTTTLQFSATAVATPVNFYYLISAPENPGTYYASGHLQFDMMLSQSGLTGSFQVGYGYQTAASGGTTATTGSYSISVSSLNTTSFTHISIPLSYFAANSSLVVEPFYITGPSPNTVSPPNPNSQKVFTVDNIQWTSN